MDVKLTERQRTAILRALCGADSSYSMRASISTCEALERRGLLRADRTKPGAFYSPRTAIKWQLTPRGREVAETLSAYQSGI